MNPPHNRAEKPPNDEQYDGETPLTPAERAHVRRILDEDNKATWLRGRVKIIWPWIAAAAVAVVGVIDWIQKHIKWAS